MATAEIDLVRGLFHDWNTHGTTPPAELIAPDFELSAPLAEERGAPYRGAAGVGAWVADLNDSYGSFLFEVDELEQHGDRVLVLGRIEVEARGTAAGLAEPAAWVIQIRDGRFQRMEMFADAGQARAAVAQRAALAGETST